uniref:Uncharacterized protein n=2 Tax=Meloidogyne enterolobii TaxID=390850 RepID=A0A6V7UPX1_MELEN|nr:unnamed protein product [Meloidogyne enterolobii]
MIGYVLENLSNKKLFCLLAALFFLQCLFFLLGAIFAPGPSSSMEFLLSACKDKDAGKTNKWFYLRPDRGNCEIIHDLRHHNPTTEDARDLVFVAQMPHMRDGIQLEYSPLFQFLLGYLDVNFEFTPETKPVEKSVLMEFEVRIGYKEKGEDSPENWKELLPVQRIRRTTECLIDENQHPGLSFNCSLVDFFQLSSVQHPFYLLNIRIPANQSLCFSKHLKGPNCAFPGPLRELRLITIHQNGGFTVVWLFLKTILFPLVFVILRWYWKRIKSLPRNAVLVEKAIAVLGDIKQGLFYAILFSFWLIFCGEHLIDDPAKNNFFNYWRNLSLVLISCFSLLIFDICERGRQLSNPFHSIWSSEDGYPNIAFVSIFLGILSIFIYFVFLCFKVYKVWIGIRSKREAQLYHLSESRRFRVENVIYRFKFLMILTIFCAFTTIFAYLMQRQNEENFNFFEPEEFELIENKEEGENNYYLNQTFLKKLISISASAFLIGIFGQWNLYVLLLLALYAPSHKHFNNLNLQALNNEDNNEEEENFNVGIDATPLTTFLKQATD